VTHHPRRSWLSEAIIIATLMLLPLLFWWRLWALDPADRAVIPSGDFTEQYYPLQLFSARELAAGRLPAWDPYINAGQPGLADIQTGLYYPLNLIPNLVFALLGQPFSIGFLTAQVVIHFSLASLFTYLLVRHLARRAGARVPAARFAGTVSALAFTYGGYLTTFPVQQLTILETAVWLPLVLLFLDRAFFCAKRLPQIVCAGLALACSLLAGHPQTAMYVVYVLLAYGLFLTWSTHRGWGGTDEDGQTVRAKVSHGILTVLLVLVLGIALAAVQIWPTLGFIAHSTRAGLEYDAVAWGFPLSEVTHMLYPGYFGGSPQYLGILPMILALASLFIVRARREVVFWLVLGLVALLLAFGGNTFLYSVTYLLAPGFGAVRNQERVIFLFAFAVSILAGYGALTLAQPLPRPKRKGFCRFSRGLWWIFVAFLALTVLFYFGYLLGQQNGVEINLFEGLLRHHILLLLLLGGSALLFNLRYTGRARRRWLMILTLGLIWLNLFTINWRFNLADQAANDLYPETGITAYLGEQPGLFRVSSAGHLPGGASAAIVYELEDITGNTPLRLDRFQQFEDSVESWRRWQLLNVHYVLSRKRLDGPGLERVFGEGGVRVYRIGDPLPRAWIVYNTVVRNDDQAINTLNTEDFDPANTVVLEPEDEDLRLSGGRAPGTAAQVSHAVPGKLHLDVSSEDAGILVVSQPFYPGWRATVDGDSVPIRRVDYMLQGIPIAAGKHRVELEYTPSRLPALLSLVVLLICGTILVLAGFCSKRA
jgi:hypothetical protein